MRFQVDLDGDGKLDQLVAGPAYSFGTMGGTWSVLLNRDGKMVKIGSITAHPKAIAVEPDHDRNLKDPAKRVYARIWVYLRGDGRSGNLGYYRVGEKSVGELKSIEIYPGDGGTDLGRSVYSAVMEHTSVPLKLERCKTDAAGKEVWETAEP